MPARHAGGGTAPRRGRLSCTGEFTEVVRQLAGAIWKWVSRLAWCDAEDAVKAPLPP